MTDEQQINGLIERVTEKQRECLRLVWCHKGSKDISRTLGISPHTVDGRVKTAMRALGVEDRFEAARIVVQAETKLTDQPLIYPPSDVHIERTSEPSLSPWKLGERQAEHLAVEEAQAPYRLAPSADTRRFSPPLPGSGRRANDLSSSAKLFWVAAIAIGTTFAFGVLASGLEALSRLG